MELDLDAIIEEARRQGFRIESTKKGWVFYAPDTSKRPVFCHKTPSDRRALRNFLAELRRAGFRMPERKEE